MIPRTLVVEDKAPWRERLAADLRAEGYEVHLATSLEEARRLLDQVKPDVLVLDMQLRAYGYQGWTILDELDAMPNGPEVIVVTDQITDPRQHRDMRQGYGVFDVILKKYYHKDHFIQTVRDAVEAKHHADAEKVEIEPSAEPSPVSKGNSPCPLTEKEKAVMREMARGKSSKIIAKDLGMAVDTVKTHKSHIYKKFNVTNAIEALLAARKLGCISGDDDNLM